MVEFLDGVLVFVNGCDIVVKGFKGELNFEYFEGIVVKIDDDGKVVCVMCESDDCYV